MNVTEDYILLAGTLNTCRLNEAASTTVMSSEAPSIVVSVFEMPYLADKKNPALEKNSEYLASPVIRCVMLKELFERLVFNNMDYQNTLQSELSLIKERREKSLR